METIDSKKVNLAQYLRDCLKHGKTNFVFKKKDNTRREAVGTLDFDLIPEADKQFKSEEQREERDDQVTYYDLEKMAWRCCKTESILSIDGKEVV